MKDILKPYISSVDETNWSGNLTSYHILDINHTKLHSIMFKNRTDIKKTV